MEDHTRADKEFLITVSYLMDVANRAVELFESSEPEQKRQILNDLGRIPQAFKPGVKPCPE